MLSVSYEACLCQRVIASSKLEHASPWSLWILTCAFLAQAEQTLCTLCAQEEYVGVLNLALRVRSDLSGCLSNGACAFNLWSTAMLARHLVSKGFK